MVCGTLIHFRSSNDMGTRLQAFAMSQQWEQFNFGIQYSMGNNGNCAQHTRTYYELQLSLFKWRADPNHNAYLPRVHFSPRQSFLQKQKFSQMLEQQLQDHLFLDTELLRENRGCKDTGGRNLGEVIVFQQYAARLATLEGALLPGECIYVLLGLLEGYQRILGRMGRTHISLHCCFVTMQGQIRAWISDNPASNDLQDDFTQQEDDKEVRRHQIYSSQAGVIKRLVELNRRLSSGSRQYEQFWSDLRQFIKINILQNCNFAAVRRFVNKYLFSHRITLPYNLARALQRSKVVRFETTPSEQEITKPEDSHIATKGQLSTQVHFDYLQPPHQELRKCNSFSLNPQAQEYKLASESACRTPKTEQKFNPLDSTFINSQILLSRGKQNLKKGQSFHKSKNQLEKPKEKGNEVKFSQAHPSFLKKQRKDTAKVSVKFHSRQPSVDQETTSMLISPTQKIDFGVHYSYTPHSSLHEQEANSSELQRPEQTFSNPPSGEKLNSQLLARQVSGLVSNKQLSICESMGTFQSIENSKDSGYKGVLMKMGRTAKILNIPTGKRLATFFRNPEGQPHLTQ